MPVQADMCCILNVLEFIFVQISVGCLCVMNRCIGMIKNAPKLSIKRRFVYAQDYREASGCNLIFFNTFPFLTYFQTVNNCNLMEKTAIVLTLVDANANKLVCVIFPY